MYLLDTNVISELRKKSAGRANPNVIQWEQGVHESTLFVSVITLFELELGVLRLERHDARQGGILRSWLDEQVVPAFGGRILGIDLLIARRAAALHVPDPKSDRDALIAATALQHDLTVITRNVSDFIRTGVTTINPWD